MGFRAGGKPDGPGSRYLAEGQTGADQIKAFVGIGMGQHKGTVADIPDALGKIRIPVLDIYGSQDLDTVLLSADARKMALTGAGNQASRQEQVMGADHFFRGLDSSLVMIVATWLNRSATGVNAKPGPAN